MSSVVVTTDLSANSKAGMRFAIRMAQSSGAKLVFLYIHFVLPDAFWSNEIYQNEIEKVRQLRMAELDNFVKKVYRSMKVKPEKYKLVVYHNAATVDGIIGYAGINNPICICISTHGAGTLKKIIGTNAGSLIKHAHIPVLCIPSAYRQKALHRVVYFSDMDNYVAELERLVTFVKPMGVGIDMFHFTNPGEHVPGKDVLEKALHKKLGCKITVHLRQRNIVHTLLHEIDKAVAELKPSIVVMFTRQNKPFWDSILLPGKTKAYSFYTKTPLLSFNKAIG